MIENRDKEFRDTITFKFRLWVGHDPTPDQMAAWLKACQNGTTGDEIDEALSKEPESIAFLAKPPAPPPSVVPVLQVRGNDFVDEHGARIVRCGCDMFLAFRQYLDGGDEALAPFLEESQALGFDTWRVFMMGSKRQNQVMDLSPSEPRYYDQVRSFAELVNAHGIVLLATIFVDAQDVMPNADQRAMHWGRMADALRGTQTLLSGGNQWAKNGFHPDELADPRMLWSRGSNLGDLPTPPHGAPAGEFHMTRESTDRVQMDAVASVINLRSVSGYGMCWMTEGWPCDENSDPQVFWEFGRLFATKWALAVFHDRAGQRGLLKGPVVHACAEAWVRGMRL